MNKKGLVEKVADKVGVAKSLTEKIIDASIDVIESEVSEKRVVKIPGFGKFESRLFRAKKGTNPKTGEVIKIPERVFPKFSAGKNFKELVAIHNKKSKGKKRRSKKK